MDLSALIAPVIAPDSGVWVKRTNALRMVSPARVCNPSVMMIMPSKNRPNPPSDWIARVKVLICTYLVAIHIHSNPNDGAGLTPFRYSNSLLSDQFWHGFAHMLMEFAYRREQCFALPDDAF